jgi:hypothetical protein
MSRLKGHVQDVSEDNFPLSNSDDRRGQTQRSRSDNLYKEQGISIDLERKVDAIERRLSNLEVNRIAGGDYYQGNALPGSEVGFDLFWRQRALTVLLAVYSMLITAALIYVVGRNTSFSSRGDFSPSSNLIVKYCREFGAGTIESEADCLAKSIQIMQLRLERISADVVK